MSWFPIIETIFIAKAVSMMFCTKAILSWWTVSIFENLRRVIKLVRKRIVLSFHVGYLSLWADKWLCFLLKFFPKANLNLFVV